MASLARLTAAASPLASATYAGNRHVSRTRPRPQPPSDASHSCVRGQARGRIRQRVCASAAPIFRMLKRARPRTHRALRAPAHVEEVGPSCAREEPQRIRPQQRLLARPALRVSASHRACAREDETPRWARCGGPSQCPSPTSPSRTHTHTAPASSPECAPFPPRGAESRSVPYGDGREGPGTPLGGAWIAASWM